jgi:hypothetical protein
MESLPSILIKDDFDPAFRLLWIHYVSESVGAWDEQIGFPIPA